MKMNQITKEFCALIVSLCKIKEVDDFIKSNKFNPQEALRFKFDLAILNIFLAIRAINLFIPNEDEAKKIIDPVFKNYMNLFVEVNPKMEKDEFSKLTVVVGDFVKRESELRLLKAIIKVQINKDVDIKNLRTDWRMLAEMLYNIRQAGYRRAIENQGNLGPMFSIAREFSRHFTGDEENGWLVVELSLLFSLFNVILIDFCKLNLV